MCPLQRSTHEATPLLPVPSVNKEETRSKDSHIQNQNGGSYDDANNDDGTSLLLWKIRILYLSYYASTGSLIPYLPVYYRSLGHGGQMIGLLSSLRSGLSFAMGPIWGWRADEDGDTMSLLQQAVVGSLVGYLSIGLASEGPTFLALAVVGTSVFYAPVKSLMDSMVLERLNTCHRRHDFGKLRLFGPIGFGLGCCLSGILATQSNTQHGYKAVFALFAAWNVPLLATLWTFPKRENPFPRSSSHSKSESKSKQGLLRSLPLLPKETWLFFLLVLILGINYGAVETFCYVRMREVGASGQQIGFSRLLSAVAGTPMFWFSTRITKRYIPSELHVLILCLLAYALRLQTYALARTPMEALPAEAIRGITFAVYYSTASDYAHYHSPKGLSSTMLMIVNSIYGGLGQSVGSTLAGMLQDQMGTLKMFEFFVVADGVFLVALAATSCWSMMASGSWKFSIAARKPKVV